MNHPLPVATVTETAKSLRNGTVNDISVRRDRQARHLRQRRRVDHHRGAYFESWPRVAGRGAPKRPRSVGQLTAGYGQRLDVGDRWRHYARRQSVHVVARLLPRPLVRGLLVGARCGGGPRGRLAQPGRRRQGGGSCDTHPCPLVRSWTGSRPGRWRTHSLRKRLPMGTRLVRAGPPSWHLRLGPALHRVTFR